MKETLKDWYFQTRWFFRKLKNGIGNLIFYFPTIWKDQPWDYGYMLELEHRKIKRMLQWWSHEENTHLENYKQVYRDLKWCDDLLDILIDDTKYLECVYEGKWKDIDKDTCELVEAPVLKFNHYVYTGNADRFLKGTWADKAKLEMRGSFQSHLYNEKAWHLYHELRKNNMRDWWD